MPLIDTAVRNAKPKEKTSNVCLALAALDCGADLVAAVTGTGAQVDAWTIDADLPKLRHVLQRLIAAGCHQITSNDPEALRPLVEEIAACS
jgi:glycerophosphoryl diester phosphodiesterase